MPSQFFDKFPIIEYSNNVVRNIFAKVVLDDASKQQPENFIQIRLNDDVSLRADVIADRYYGSPYFDWIHYMSNDVVDPYGDVFLDSESFLGMIVKKYGNIELAKQKTVFYINNWSDKPEDKLSVSQYENASKNIKKYYTADIDYANRIIGYVRHRKDWTKVTNKIRILQIDKTTSMIPGDLIAQFVSGQQVASAEVIDVNTVDNKITIKNITGEFVTTVGNIVYRFDDNTQYSVSSIISPHTEDNITTEEASYWSPVSYFDRETEINELKRNVKLLRKEGVSLISKNLQKLLE
jgi:hypothetical protein